MASFIKLRLKHLLQEKHIRYDLIDAVLGNDIGNVSTLIAKGKVLEAKRTSAGFKENMEALSRVLNISSKAEQAGEIQAALFENDSEKQLHEQYLSVNAALHEQLSEEEYY